MAELDISLDEALGIFPRDRNGIGVYIPERIVSISSSFTPIDDTQKSPYYDLKVIDKDFSGRPPPKRIPQSLDWGGCHISIFYSHIGVRDISTYWKGLARSRNVGSTDYCALLTVFDRIYHDIIDRYELGELSKEDMLLLRISVMHVPMDEKDVVMLTRIVRNSFPSLKGIGKEFYENLKPLLKEKGYNFLKLIPENSKLFDYWKGLGLKEHHELNSDIQDHVLKSEKKQYYLVDVL